MTEQYIKLNTGAKEIQQVNPHGFDNSQSIRPSTERLRNSRIAILQRNIKYETRNIIKKRFVLLSTTD